MPRGINRSRRGAAGRRRALGLDCARRPPDRAPVSTTESPAADAPLWRRIAARLRFTWFEADPRALGLFRIAFGLLCIWDVLRRVPWIDVFYSNAGVLSNHYSLFRPHSSYTFSMLLSLGSPGEVAVFFGFTLVCLVLFTMGAFTRVTHVLSMLCIISIHSRNVLLENGGDVVMNLWWLWTLWLPLGRRLSIDALRASMKRKESPGQVNHQPAPDRRRVVSLAVFAVLWQLAVIYFFNTVHKSGRTWTDGTALAWTLEQDRIVTGLGLWVRDAWPLWTTRAMTWGTLVIEGAAPLLLLSPIGAVWTRRIAIATLTGLHVGIFLLTDVGLFSPTMVVAYFILLSPADIALLKRGLRRLAGPAIIVAYDSDCGICHWCARLGARLDRLGLVTWLGRDPDGPLPPGWTRERFDSERDETIMAWVPGGDRVWLRHRALARALAALPLGRLVAWIPTLPLIDGLLERAYRLFAVRRHRFGAWCGLGVCGVAIGGFAGDDDEGPSDARRLWHRARWVGAQLVIVFFLLATGSQLLIENRFVRDTLGVEHSQPTWARMAVHYGRFFQGWSMFAPDAPTGDGWMVIEAELDDGRVIDPQTGEPPVFGPCDATRMVEGQFWGSYTSRLAGRRNSKYRGEFEKWLRRTKVRRLHVPAGTRVVRYTAWWLPDRSPRPGSGAEPTLKDRQKIAAWPKR